MNGTEPIVYVVEPDEAVRDSLRTLIRRSPLSVETFASAEEFLGHYDAGRAGCLVLEMELPGMSGLDLQRHLAERGIDLPVIALSTLGSVTAAVQAMRGGAIDFLEKPYLPRVLMRRVREAVGQRTEPASPRRTI